jgi:hypothetical protein
MHEASAETNRRGAAGWLVCYLCGLSLACFAGYRMEVHQEYWQLLASGPLTDRLAESLANLHGQPPLLNLVYGLALKLERGSGCPVAASLGLLQIATGAVAILALRALLLGLAVARWLRRLVLALVVLDPALYQFVLDFFYPIYELALLALAAVAVHRYLVTRRAQAFAAACALLTALALTRALFHFAWVLVVLIALALGSQRPRAARTLATLAVAGVALLAWPVKNYLRFGFFGMSSWQGYNLSQGFVGSYPPIWVAFVDGSLANQEAARQAITAQVPERWRTIPVLSDVLKSPGVPNWNHVTIISLARDLERRVLAHIWEHPSILAAKAIRNYRQATIFPGRHPWAAELDWRAHTPLAQRWLELYEQAVFLYAGDNPQEGPLPGFAWILPVALTVVGAQIIRRWRREPAASRTAAYLLAAVLWVLLMILLVDGREGGRMRFSSQPLLYVALAWSLGRQNATPTAVG